MKSNNWYIFLLYCCCFGVVFLYVNTFVLWAWVRATFGSNANFFPAILTGILLLGIGYHFHYLQNNKKELNNTVWLFLSVALTVFTFFLPDPDFPIKRIHVVQYFLLACLVRYPLSLRVRGSMLTFYTAVVTLLFGIHDELLQGLHPLRTFGLRDILVNGFAGLAGSLFTHYICLYGNSADKKEKQKKQPAKTDHRSITVPLILLFILIIPAVGAYLLPLPYFRNSVLPYWLAAPLMGSLAAWGIFIDNHTHEENKHCMTIVLWLLFLLPLYSIFANVSPLQFN